MLVLSRNVNEIIRVNSNITIQITEVRGNKVRLGFDAPDDCIILREEIFQQIMAEGKEMHGPKPSERVLRMEADNAKLLIQLEELRQENRLLKNIVQRRDAEEETLRKALENVH